MKYFDLYRSFRDVTVVAHGGGDGAVPPNLNRWLVAHYLALCFGIVAKLFLDQHKKQAEFTWLSVVIAVILTTISFPTVYRQAVLREEALKKASLHPNPIAVELCLSFTCGFGVHALVSDLNGIDLSVLQES